MSEMEQTPRQPILIHQLHSSSRGLFAFWCGLGSDSKHRTSKSKQQQHPDREPCIRQLHLYLIMERHRAMMEQKMTHHYPVGNQPPSQCWDKTQNSFSGLASVWRAHISVRWHLILCFSRTLLPALQVTAISLEKAESTLEAGTFSVCNIKPH